MSVKVAVPRDIESSFNSSINMPDTTRDEEEWQNKDQKLALSGVMNLVNVDGFGLMIDAIMTSDYVFVLDRKELPGTGLRHYLSKYTVAGGLLGQVEVSPRSGYTSDSIPRCLSLSSETISVGWINIPAQADPLSTYEFEFVDYSGGNLSQVGVRQISEMSGKIVIQDWFVISFRFDAGVFLCATEPSDQSEKRRIESYVDGVKIAHFTPELTSNFTAVAGQIITTQRTSRVVGGRFFVDANYYDYSFKNLRSEVLEVYSPTVERPVVMSISTNEELLTVLSRGDNNYQFAKTQIVDLNMINIGSYKRNDEVIKSSTKRKYRCAVDATFDDPELGVNLSPPTWVDTGSVNKFAVLDSNTSQRSIFNGGGFVSCSITNPVDTVGIFGLSGVQSATVSVIDGGSTLYTETKSGMDSEFADVEVRDIVFSAPPFSNVTIRVDLTGSNVRVGRFAVGVGETIGRAVPGTELGDIDYSILEFDEFGNTRYVPRPIVSFHTFQVDVAKQKSLSVARKLQSIGGKDAIWSADVGLSEPLVAIGKCERFPITYDNPTLVSYTVKVRGTA